MRKKLLVGLGPLAVAAMIGVPAAQGAVPPTKRFPKVFVNGVKATPLAAPKRAIAVGNIKLENAITGNLTCNNVVTGSTFNETTEGTEKGFLNSTGYMTFECVSKKTCKVTNTKGEKVEGIYITAEAPPVVKGTEIHNAGITSLPWTGELIERETEKTQVLTKHVKIWIVLPPGPPIGEGEGCAGTELEFEDQEGATEKEAGDELAPIWINGSHNGLKPSHEEYSPSVGEGKTEKGGGPPVTGLLVSPQVGPSFVEGKLFVGGLGGAWELVTAQ